MKREIKFRVWKKSNKDLGFDDDQIIEREMIYFWLGDIYWRGEETGDYSFPYDYHVMQFTGLTDKNGKDIYEGDILKDQYTSMIDRVCFDAGRFCIYKSGKGLYKYHPNNLDVVGNIHENPELL